MESADVEKAWRCVLQHDVVELASFCSFASASKTALRCASDAEVDTLRWRPEFKRRFPWLSSTESRTLSVARSAQIWQGEECKFSTCWRRTYLGVVQSWPRAGTQQRYDANARLEGVLRDGRCSATFDAACKAIELHGATTGDAHLAMALKHDVVYSGGLASNDTENARHLFVLTVLASNPAPFWQRAEPPDRKQLVISDLYETMNGPATINVLTRCAKCLHVRSLRAVLASPRFLGSTPAFRRAAISAAVEGYLDLDLGVICVLPPRFLLLEDQPGYGGGRIGQDRIDFIRRFQRRDGFARNAALYRRMEAIGEILRGVAEAADITRVDEYLVVLRTVMANFERYPALESDSDESD